MSFFDAVGGLVSDVIDSISGIGTDVMGGISAVGSAASSINLSSILGAISNVGSLIGEVSNSIHGFIDPIAQIIHGIGDTINQINDGIIKPIVDPIRESISASSALIDALNKDLGQGLQGILQIPRDITNAINSVDAVMQRTVMQLAEQSMKTATDVIAPAMDKASSVPLMNIHDYYRASVDSVQSFLEQHQKITLTEPTTDSQLLDKVNEGLEWLSQQKGVYEVIGNALVFLADILPVLEARREPALDLIREKIQKATPTAKLPVADVATLYLRGVLNLEQALEEIQLQNFSRDRADAIIELSRSLVGVGDLLNSWHRKQLDDQALNDRLAQLGFNDVDAELLTTASYTLPDPNMVLDWLHRKLINEDDANAMLGWLGYRPDMISRLSAASVRLAGVDDLIMSHDRLPLWHAVWHVDAPDVIVPDDVLQGARLLGVDDSATTKLWTNHFQALSPGLACQAWFRGSISKDQLEAMLSAAAIPNELHATYIETQRPLIPFRTIPAMLAAGMVDEVTARLNLEAYGYTPENAAALIDYALGRGKKTTTAADATLHGLTQSTIIDLYKAGAVPQDKAVELLTAIGISQEAAALAIQLEDVRAQMAERKAETDLILAEASAGAITFTEAQSQLSQIGLTTLEIEKAVNTLLRDMKKQQKMPTEAQLTSMWKHSLIDDTVFHDTLILLGYSEFWANNLMALAGAVGASVSGV